MRLIRFSALAVILCMLFCALCACGEPTAETAADGQRYNVYDDDGNLTGYERRYHDINGNLSRLDVYDVQEEYDHYVLYEYDSKNRLIQETTYKANGLGDFYYSYQYDDEDNVIEKGYYTAENGAEVTKYDSDGNEIEVLSYDRYADLVSRRVLEDGEWHTYDADDKEITD